MKIVLIFAIALAGSLAVCSPADGMIAVLASPVDDMGGMVDLGPIQGFLEEINRNLELHGQRLSIDDILGIFRGDVPFGPSEMLGLFISFFLGEVRINMLLLGQLVALGVLAALLEGFHDSLGTASVGKVASMVLCMALLVLGLVSLTSALSIAQTTVDTLVGFMLAVLPILLTLLIGVGAVTSAGIFHPILAVVVHAVGVIVAEWVFPLLFLAAIISVLGFLGPQFQVARLASLVRQVGMTILGVAFSVFLGVVSVQGAAGAVADGVTLRTAKFLAKSTVPVVGSMFADAAEMVFGSALLLKNAVGFLGLIMVVGLVVFPLLKLVALILVYRAAAAVVDLVGGQQTAGILGGLAGGLSSVTLAVGVLSLMFLTALTAIMAAANVAVMMR